MENEAKELTLHEIQSVEYEILCSIVDFFENKNLNYILCGGTMLGAVRHNGFIPWDDDIDILVPREDYERFKEFVRNGECDFGHIDIKIPGDEDYPYPFIKAFHNQYSADDGALDARFPLFAWIDIFPLDHFSDNPQKHRTDVAILVGLKGILYSGILCKSFFQRAHYHKLKNRFLLICKRILYYGCGGYKNVARLIDFYAKKMNNRNKHSKHFGDGAWPEGMKDYFEEESVFPIAKHIFVDREFNVPQNYDAYLTSFYGDYMTPPPINQQNSHHIKCFYKGGTSF